MLSKINSSSILNEFLSLLSSNREIVLVSLWHPYGHDMLLENYFTTMVKLCWKMQRQQYLQDNCQHPHSLFQCWQMMKCKLVLDESVLPTLHKDERLYQLSYQANSELVTLWVPVTLSGLNVFQSLISQRKLLTVKLSEAYPSRLH